MGQKPNKLERAKRIGQREGGCLCALPSGPDRSDQILHGRYDKINLAMVRAIFSRDLWGLVIIITTEASIAADNCMPVVRQPDDDNVKHSGGADERVPSSEDCPAVSRARPAVSRAAPDGARGIYCES
jgi:hypothetical protein